MIVSLSLILWVFAFVFFVIAALGYGVASASWRRASRAPH